jgi:hypothetical protein
LTAQALAAFLRQRGEHRQPFEQRAALAWRTRGIGKPILGAEQVAHLLDGQLERFQVLHEPCRSMSATL